MNKNQIEGRVDQAKGKLKDPPKGKSFEIQCASCHYTGYTLTPTVEGNFVASLKEDTGRDLDGWMIAIRHSGHSDRNEIIDWLRHQGFQFSWASWLERIHHNGGRLVYGDDVGNVPPLARPRPPEATRQLDRRPFHAVPKTAPPAPPRSPPRPTCRSPR